MRIAFIADHIRETGGYPLWAREVGRELHKRGHRIFNVQFQSDGVLEPYREPGWTVPILPAGENGKNIVSSVEDCRADVAVHVRDLWNYSKNWNKAPYSLIDQLHENGVGLVNVSPIDQQPVPSDLVWAAEHEGDFLFTMTKWSSNVLSSQGVPREKLGHFAHGVDPNVFRPTGKWDPSRFGLPDDPSRTMVLFVGKNIGPRKMHPLAMLAFKEYLKVDPTAFLYMFSPPLGYYNLVEFGLQMGFTKDQLFLYGATEASARKGIPDEAMAQLFNRADCYLSLSAAEGFNSPFVQALCMGTPCVVTDFPVHREVAEPFFNCAEYVNAQKVYPHPSGWWWMADPKDAAEKIAKAVEGGRRKPMYPRQYLWPTVADTLEEVLNRLVPKKKVAATETV